MLSMASVPCFAVVLLMVELTSQLVDSSRASAESRWSIVLSQTASGENLSSTQAAVESSLRRLPSSAANELLSPKRTDTASVVAHDIAQLTSILRKNPRDAEALTLRGFVLAALREYAHAESDFRAALTTGKSVGDGIRDGIQNVPQVYLGLLLWQMGNARNGAKEVTAALRQNPRSPHLHEYLAMIYTTLGNPAEAAAYQRQAERLNPLLASNPGHPQAILVVSRAWVRLYPYRLGHVNYLYGWELPVKEP
jgi:tetratricopeptide (TPR) repeat protein